MHKFTTHRLTTHRHTTSWRAHRRQRAIRRSFRLIGDEFTIDVDPLDILLDLDPGLVVARHGSSGT